jgi:hypothetical protein
MKRVRSPEYWSWVNMKARCSNPRATQFKDYGGRGITVCARWASSFEAFLADVGPKPGPGFTIDRIDNAGHYEPGNVRWADEATQKRNSRRNRFIEFAGERLCITDWAARLGIDFDTLDRRIKRGWPIEKALTTRRLAKGREFVLGDHRFM